MTNDHCNGTGVERCEISTATEETETCTCTAESGDNAVKEAATKVIDFKQRSSELRIKGSQSGSVPPFEATKALAFGMMYLKGEGVEKDTAKAAGFLEKAAKGDVSQARHELALLHLAGTGVPYDPDYARHLLQLAADDGYLPSMVQLAELYLFGRHNPKDLEQALEILYAASAKSEPAAMYYLALIYDKEPEYRNSFEAAYWYRRAAEYGHFKSQIRLASLYATGEGVPLCLETAEAFLEVAMESKYQQDPRFLFWQGERFVTRPETKFLAQALIKAAAEMEHPPAQRSLLQHGWRA